MKSPIPELAGIGINDEELERVMGHFARVHTDPEIEQEGTGLGLPLSKGLVELHGGQLVITSEPGEGTKVRISLPGAIL